MRFEFDERGTARLGLWSAGRFRCRTLKEMKIDTSGSGSGHLKLCVLLGTGPLTDIGALQSLAPPRTLFQVASQFNCLEAPVPRIVSVSEYLQDPTQGPRASISAFPGTLLRHYAAPGHDGERFVQKESSRQLNLLEKLMWDNLAEIQNGYLRKWCISDPQLWSERLEEHFEEIAVGVHEDVEVVMGADWFGGVPGKPLITQVLTSTLAAGLYGEVDFTIPVWEKISTRLLQAAYLGTLLAACSTGQRRVVLTLIGGGVFGNPAEIIWESILWACEQVKDILTTDLTVIVNGRELADQVCLQEVHKAVELYHGVVVRCTPQETAVLHR